EGTLGGGRACDIRLRGLKRRQVDFAYVDGKGILLTPCHRRGDTLLDGEPIHRGAYALHGAILRVGGYTLRIRLFAGLNVPHPAQYQEQHWQPVFEEELYGSGVMGVPAPYPQQAYDAPQQWMATQPLPVIHMPEDGQEAPLPFGAAGEAEPQWMQTQPIPVVRPMPEAEPYAAEPWPEEEQLAPAPFEGEDAAPADDGMPAPFAMPARHRRSDRRREL
ncbi:MAG: hypothetical protein IJS53_03335, partial [Clostridia bacterium]|nr:hypothetical protein [Clostridia bacterium]